MEPVLSLKQKREVSFDRCIICQAGTSRSKPNPLSEATSAGIAALKHATEARAKSRNSGLREAVDRLSLIFEDSSEDPKLLYHRTTCYANYTHKNKLEKLSKEFLLPRPVASPSSLVHNKEPRPYCVPKSKKLTGTCACSAKRTTM